MRTLAITVFLTLLLHSTMTLAEETGPKLEIGDFVVVRLEGEAAEKYAEQTGEKLLKAEDGEGSRWELATVTWILADGQLRIKHSSDMFSERHASKLVTVVATVPSDRLIPVVTKAGTLVHSWERFHNVIAIPRPTEKDSTGYHLRLSKMNDVEMTIWD